MKAFVFSLLIILVLSSCKKDNPEPTKVPNRYLQSVTILSVTTFNWDNLSDPDLKINLRRNSSSGWEYTTYTINNNSTYPVTITFSNEILATDENWQMQLVDDDSPDNDDEICIVTFNPITTGSNGKIPFTKNSQDAMELNYQDK